MIYSLGGGCWVRPIPEIKNIWYSDSIFGRAVLNYKQYKKYNVFIPLFLFNKKLENYLLNLNSYNISNDNLLLDYFLIAHINNVKNNEISIIDKLKNKKYVKQYFQNFYNNSYNYFYIIDFQRCGWNIFTNENLLEFEDYLLSNNYNLNKFVYLDVKDDLPDNSYYIYIKNENYYKGFEEDRFKKLKIKHYINSLKNPNGIFYINKTSKTWRNTQCFLNEHFNDIKLWL